MAYSPRLLFSLAKQTTKNVFASKTARNVHTSVIVKYSAPSPSSSSNVSMPEKIDHNNYSVPLRAGTMDDLMEPYGDWKVAYEKEIRDGNFRLLRGVVCLTITLVLFIQSGVADDLWMPNLDNIIADTDPHIIPYDKEGRISA